MPQGGASSKERDLTESISRYSCVQAVFGRCWSTCSNDRSGGSDAPDRKCIKEYLRNGMSTAVRGAKYRALLVGRIIIWRG